MKKYKRVPAKLYPKKGDIIAFKTCNGKFALGQILHAYDPKFIFEFVVFKESFDNLPTTENLELKLLHPFLHGAIVSPQQLIYVGDREWFYIGNSSVINYGLPKLKSSLGSIYPDTTNTSELFRTAFEYGTGLKTGKIFCDHIFVH